MKQLLIICLSMIFIGTTVTYAIIETWGKPIDKKPIMLKVRGKDKHIEWDGKKLYYDTDMQVWAIYGQSAIFVYNKATGEAYRVEVDGLKTRVYKK